jgi:hypothetical protein
MKEREKERKREREKERKNNNFATEDGEGRDTVLNYPPRYLSAHHIFREVV